MTSKKIIERLQKGDWVIDVKNPREVYEVINHAEKSGLKIRYLAERVNMILTDESSNLGNACNDGLSVFYGYSNEAIKDLGMENITDWFFSEINNPQAFTSTNKTSPYGDGETIYDNDYGMTLLDYFAAKAMNKLFSFDDIKLNCTASVAEFSYQMAKAMLVEREKVLKELQDEPHTD